MTASYRIQAVRDEEILMRGMAWFVDAQTIVTAFHVVGDERSGDWWHTIMPGLDYQLLSGDDIISLAPLAADESADIALLKPSQTPANAQVLKLAEATAIERGISWHSDSFPAFHHGVFGLDGSISRIGNGVPAKALQLIVEQGTQVDWSGVSGSPVQIDRRVAGLITQMTGGTKTGLGGIGDCHSRVVRKFRTRQSATKIGDSGRYGSSYHTGAEPVRWASRHCFVGTVAV